MGKAALAFDATSNTVGVGRGVKDAYQNGLGYGNTLQIVGGAAGLGGNIAAGGKALREIASDAGRVRFQPAGAFSGVPIQGKLYLAPKKAAASLDALVAEAQLRYPNKAGVPELHHVEPIYLGGAKNGARVQLDAAYHQQITNAFRAERAYGKGPVSSADLERIKGIVYGQFPLPRGSR